uniref:Uncharacterized protein n=1 Tax=Toxoplasma gondii COUG TaxID=1074873 RepID=A0A2G8XNI3_TOXGO|nr:hypothetical protein TGCOUG_216155 [Toxoplasma gondii COUG]
MKSKCVRLVPFLYCGIYVVSGTSDKDFQAETEITSSFVTGTTCSRNAPRWNLEEHFPRLREDERNTADDAVLDRLEERAIAFAEQHRGTLDRSLGDALEEYEKIDEELDRFAMYWSLKTSQNLADDTLRRKRSKADTRASR